MTQHLQQPKDFIPNHFVVLHQLETDQVETEMNTSFNVSLLLSEVTHQVSEMATPCPPPDDIITNQPISFEIVQGGCTKGGDILVESIGLTYVPGNSKERQRHGSVVPSHGSRKCFSTVNQRGNRFLKGNRRVHNHPGNLEHCCDAKLQKYSLQIYYLLKGILQCRYFSQKHMPDTY